MNKVRTAMRFLLSLASVVLGACGAAPPTRSEPSVGTVVAVVDYDGTLGKMRLCDSDGSCGATAAAPCVLGKVDPGSQEQLNAALAALSMRSPAIQVEQFKVTFVAFKTVTNRRCVADLEGVSKVERFGAVFS